MSDCRNCLFIDNCTTYYKDCDAYSPIAEDDAEDLIEEGRFEYRRAFFEYLEEQEYFFETSC